MKLFKRNKSGKGRGFFTSFKLAWRIFTGTLTLLKRYPKLILPLLPVAVMVLLISFSLDRVFVFSTSVFLLFMGAIFVSAYALMFSFAISSQMLKQIHAGETASVTAAFTAPETVRMIKRVMALSIVWYGLVLILVIVEIIIRAILDRISDGMGERVIRAVFGTVATALRMSAFMLVAIMVFEDVGLKSAYIRFRKIIRNNSLAALGGLVLTSVTSTVIGLVIYLMDDAATALPVLAIAWLLVIYLEQMFVTGLYLYDSVPESPVVSILLGDFLGRELPGPKLAKQPLF